MGVRCRAAARKIRVTKYHSCIAPPPPLDEPLDPLLLDELELLELDEELLELEEEDELLDEDEPLLEDEELLGVKFGRSSAVATRDSLTNSTAWAWSSTACSFVQ